MTDKFRVMVRGEDGTLWCEGNNLLEEVAEELCEACLTERYENAMAWIELEAPPTFWNDSY